MNELELTYEEELEAFLIWMKDAGYTAHTQKSLPMCGNSWTV